MATLSCRPLRTSCWIVGTASPSSVRCSSVRCCAVCFFSAVCLFSVLSLRLLSFAPAPLRGRPPCGGEPGQRPASLAQTVVCCPTPALGRVTALAAHLGRWNGPDDGEEGRTRPALRSAACPAARSRFAGARARNHGHKEPEYLTLTAVVKTGWRPASATIHHSRCSPGLAARFRRIVPVAAMARQASKATWIPTTTGPGRLRLPLTRA